jgi:hydroxyacylglutathione hydrolase
MLTLEPILAFEDNYIWTVHDGRSALFVDPGEAGPILAWLAQRRMRPAAVLVTHHHGDHCGGLGEILDRYPGLPAFGPAHDRIAGVNRPVAEGSRCRIDSLGLAFEVLAVPGHTVGHVAYLGHGWLFCGDTLFACGCGKVFGSTPAALHASLTRIAALPPETLVCCAHEYTLDNIRFALAVDPDNQALLARRAAARALRESGRPTVPTRLGDELACNPFLRCGEPAIRRRLASLAGLDSTADDAAAFAAMRHLKDTLGLHSD